MVEKVLSEKDDYEYALLLARTFLRGKEKPEMSDIDTYIDLAISILQGQGRAAGIDKQRLAKEIGAELNVFVRGEATFLSDRDLNRHESWLIERKHEIQWRFWKRFDEYLLRMKHFPQEPLRKLDEHSDLILEQLEDPSREGPWSRRGLVVGQVQSGKTLNYTALINKSADAGYKLIIVLAGMWENLRVQTQGRLVEGFLGREIKQAFDITANADTRVGVGLIASSPLATCGTSRRKNGDFNKQMLQFTGVISSAAPYPVLLVVKKNKSILNNVLQWVIHSANAKKNEDGTYKISEVPMLIIDDEADHASINTNEVPEDDDGNVIEDHDPTAINGAIRKLLNTFEKNAYVGYTATPFANIFIRQDAAATDFGDELFPRSFIINLPSPSNYIGAAELFGVNPEETERTPESTAVDLVRIVDDYSDWLPDNHKNGAIPAANLPESLKRAIRSFILTCAARIGRGQEQEHNSMLIHVTRFTSVQKEVHDQVKEELNLLQKRLRYSDGASPSRLLDELRTIWENDFIPASTAMNPPPISWDEISQHLYPAASKIKVKTINGTAKDVLDYEQGTVSVIAIGGNKLARGLTLEGLSISYYLRATKMYDTLMQMVRWFGYRPGYSDLCRLYTTSMLTEWYQYISGADAELRAEFDEMFESGSEPIDYGLKVRSHPAGLIITALNKMKSGTPMKLSYSGELCETVSFYKEPSIVKRNFESTVRFLDDCSSLSNHKKERGRLIWSNIPGGMVATFISQFEVHKDAVKVRPEFISQYIRKQVSRNELIHWTVVLIANGESARAPFPMGKAGEIQLSLRNQSKRQASTADKYAIGRLVNPSDEAIDLGRFDELVPPGTKDRAKQLRRMRDKRNGLLLLYPLDSDYRNIENIPFVGFAVSFPRSDEADQVDYVVTKLFAEQEQRNR